MKERNLVVGDIHGDWGSLNELINKKQPDNVFVCGDFGWWPRIEIRKATIYEKQKPWICRGIHPQGSMVYWADGNHEDHDDLDSRGRAQKDEVWMYENCIYKPRGSLHKLKDGRIMLFFGGAESIDKDMRTPGFDWFYREIPSMTEFERAMSHDHVDIVIAHTTPTSFIPAIGKIEKTKDPTRTMLENIVQKYKPAHFYCGHWHVSLETELNGTKYHALDYPRHNGRWWQWMA